MANLPAPAIYAPLGAEEAKFEGILQEIPPEKRLKRKVLE